MAQQLMLQHGISQADLLEKAEIPTGSVLVEVFPSRVVWKSILLGAIAEFTFTRSVWMYAKGTDRQLRLFGKAHHVAVAIETYRYLTAALERLAANAEIDARLEAKHNKKGQKHSPATFRNSFYAGAVFRLGVRLKEKQLEMSQNGIPETNTSALVCLSHIEKERQAIVDFMAKIQMRPAGAVRGKLDHSGYRAGVEAGEKIGLETQLKPTQSRTQLT